MLLFVHEVPSCAGEQRPVRRAHPHLFGILSATIANVSPGPQGSAAAPMLDHAHLGHDLRRDVDALFALVRQRAADLRSAGGYWHGLRYLALRRVALCVQPLHAGHPRTIGPGRAAYSSVIVPIIAMRLSTLSKAIAGRRWQRWAPSLAIGGMLLA